MKLIMRQLSAAAMIIALVVVPTTVVLAQDDAVTDTLGDGAYVNKGLDYYSNDIQANSGLGGYDDVANEGPLLTASLIINFLLGLLGTITLALTVYAGYTWMMARGNEEEITRAKGILVGSTIGMLVVLASYSIMNYVFRSLVNITN